MAEEPFLGRTEEQAQFRRVLQSHLPSIWQRTLPTLSRPFIKPRKFQSPYLFLFYGEGGMGKTKLVRQLKRIAETEFAKQIEVLFLDWEAEKHIPSLQVGHDNIEPRSVLEVLYQSLAQRTNWGRYFEGYRQKVERLKAAESKVEKVANIPTENPLLSKVSQLGAKGIAAMIRTQTAGVNLVPTETIQLGLDTSAELLYQARQAVQRALTPEEYQVYEQPDQILAQALGKGIAAIAKQKPLVIVLDTYEIVDRPTCDYTLRQVMRQSDGQGIWVIAGRANLATSEPRGKDYFRGYAQDFPEDRLYVKEMRQFDPTEVAQYFQQVVPDRPLQPDQAEQIARFSLGIPFVISQAAAMWKEAKPIAEIVAPPTQHSGTTRDRVVKETCERFLKHCFIEPERDQDLQAIYALAILRRPDAELLRQMLDQPNLEPALQGLRQRYSFIWVDQLSLDNKLSQFLREYLLVEVRRTDQLLQRINDRAITWLELQLEAKTQEIHDRADWYDEEAIAEILLDLVNHGFWHSPDRGWRYLLPYFVEGWQYNRSWTLSLLEIAAQFTACFDRDQHRRLQWLRNALSDSTDLEDVKALLMELDKLAQRQWLDGAGVEARQAILQLKRGKLLYRQEKYLDALQHYLQVERQLPETQAQLKRGLAATLREVGEKLAVKRGTAIASPEAEVALAKAVELDSENGHHRVALGVAQFGMKKYEPAAASIERGISFLASNEKAYAFNVLGTVHLDQGKLEAAITAYQKAIELDPKFIYPHNGLGNAYQAQGQLEAAITVYRKVIKLDPKYTEAYNGLGWTYLSRNDLAAAQAAFESAIQFDPDYYSALLNLGLVYALQGNDEEAKSQWQQGLELCQGISDRETAICVLYRLALGESEQSITAMQQVIAAGASLGALRSALGDAEILANCPTKPERIDQLIDILKEAIDRLA